MKCLLPGIRGTIGSTAARSASSAVASAPPHGARLPDMPAEAGAGEPGAERVAPTIPALE